jgi:hypothetical protein
MPSSTPVTDFLVKLARDHAFAKEFADHREDKAKAAKLQPPVVQALVDNDLVALQGFVDQEATPNAVLLIMGWIR